MTVAVIGATGTIGPYIVDSLLRRETDVRVLARDAERARGLLDPRCDIHQTDIADHDALLAASAGVDSVLLLTSHAHDMSDLQLRIIRALRRSDVRIVKISGTSSAIHPDGPYTCRQHWEVEHVLGASGMRHVILRPNAFMQTLIGQILLPAVRAAGSVPNPIGSAGISFIDARDIADVAAVVLTDAAWEGRTLVLTGPRSVTYDQIAAALSEGYGVPATTVPSSPAIVRESLTARGVPAWEAEHFEEMYEMFARGESEFVTDTVAEVTGHEPRTVEAYLAENAATLQQAGSPS